MNTQEIQETEARIVGVLKSIFDPEIPVNIYDLGLIYEVRVDEEQVAHVTDDAHRPELPYG